MLLCPKMCRSLFLLMSFLLYSAGKADYMATDGAIDGCFALNALLLLLEKCFTGTIKSEN